MCDVTEFGHEELVLGDVLQRRAQQLRDKPFLRFRRLDVTYGQFDELVNRTAQGLAARGASPSGHVAVMLPNCLEFLQVVFALAKLGAPSVPINTAYKGDLLAHALTASDSSMLIVDESWLDRVATVQDQLPNLETMVVRLGAGKSAAPQRFPFETCTLASLVERPAEAPQTKVRFGDLQSLVFTGGTTGPSKGVMVSHAHSLTCARDWIRYTQFQPREIVYCPLPLFHGGALWDGVMSALLAGGEVCVVERFSASRYWDDVRRFRANVSLGVFSILPILLKQPPSPADKEHELRCFYFGQSALDEAFFQRFGVHCVETYASTEVGVATGSPYGAWRSGSCGQANSPTHDVGVVDERDRELPPNEPGELVVRPRKPFAMTTGYYGFWRETVRAFRNLWFHTGDRVYQDDEGYFYFVDRISESIRRRGENISSFEIERAVNGHPLVLESAAVGVASDVGEDDVKICVATQKGNRLDPEELIEHCRRRLPYFMVPRYVQFFDELPRSPLGKVLKGKLRDSQGPGATGETWDRVEAGVELKDD